MSSIENYRPEHSTAQESKRLTPEQQHMFELLALNGDNIQGLYTLVKSVSNSLS